MGKLASSEATRLLTQTLYNKAFERVQAKYAKPVPPDECVLEISYPSNRIDMQLIIDSLMSLNSDQSISKHFIVDVKEYRRSRHFKPNKNLSNGETSEPDVGWGDDEPKRSTLPDKNKEKQSALLIYDRPEYFAFEIDGLTFYAKIVVPDSYRSMMGSFGGGGSGDNASLMMLSGMNQTSSSTATPEEMANNSLICDFVRGSKTLPNGRRILKNTTSGFTTRFVKTLNNSSESLTLKVYCETKNHYDLVLAKISEIADESHRRLCSSDEPKMLLVSGVNSWGHRYDMYVSPRPMDTLALPEGTAESIIEDFIKFAASKDRYIGLGIPYHRGYMLHGPPGTGKSSLAKALASHFDRRLVVINLAGIKTDQSLTEQFSRIDGSKEIVLLEDIDAVPVTHQRDRDKLADAAGDEGITIGGLLNVLDGVSTPEGLILIATTNNYDWLDDALIRSNRFDMTIEVGYLDNYQLDKLFEIAYGTSAELTLPDGVEIAPGDVVGIIKQNFESVEDARSQTLELIESKC